MAAPTALYRKYHYYKLYFLKFVYTTVNAPFLDDYIMLL